MGYCIVYRLATCLQAPSDIWHGLRASSIVFVQQSWLDQSCCDKGCNVPILMRDGLDRSKRFKKTLVIQAVSQSKKRAESWEKE